MRISLYRDRGRRRPPNVFLVPQQPVSDESAKVNADPAAYASAQGSPALARIAAAFRDRYEVVRESGRGASAIVYLARDLKHDRLVAIKTLNPDVSPVAGERFLREIQVSAGMQHPHILPMYDSGVADDRLYFVMPFVDGGSLRDRLDRQPQLPIVEALRCAYDVAQALAFAHDRGVVHRDIKPENIMFYHGHACLADFGVARVMQALEMRVTGHGMIVGTPAYMSPEQLTDNGFDGRSDVYSLACVLYEMIAGQPAFSGTTPRELLNKRLRTPPDPLKKYRSDVPASVDRLLLRGLAAAPHARFPDARAFAGAIESSIRELTAPHRISAPRRLLRELPRRRLAWAASAVGIIALIALGITPLSDALRSAGPGAAALHAGTPEPRESYANGVRALDAWDLSTAEAQFARAATGSDLADAQLRYAQTLELERRVDSDPFRIAVARLSANRASLHGRDSLYADALIALGASAYPRACESFDRMRQRDSLDVMAWYGLGDCNALDSVIVRDAGSPSGFRFRSGWAAAARAYMRAVTIDPSVHRALPYGTLSGILVTSPTQIRPGRTLASGAVSFLAHPSLSADTVAFVPFPLVDIALTRARTVPPGWGDALRQNRETLLAFARQWTAAVPSSADAYEALGAAYEAVGQISTQGEGAADAIRRARTLATSADARLRTAAADVRLRLKRGELESARSLADSLLSAYGTSVPSAPEAEQLAGLAAMTGRLERAAQLNATASGSYDASLGIAPPLDAASNRLLIRAAAGVCDDSLLVLRGAVNRLLESYGQPARYELLRRTLLSRAMSLAFPCLGARALEGLTFELPIAPAQRAVASGDRTLAASALNALFKFRVGTLPGDVSLDETVQEASVRAMIGDTAAATRQLDRVLGALPTLGPWAVREPVQAAAIGRAFAYRAELAARTGDAPQARRNAQAALVLWQDADASLAPAVARLRALAALR